MGKSGEGGEELSPFFASIFPLFPPETPDTDDKNTGTCLSL